MALPGLAESMNHPVKESLQVGVAEGQARHWLWSRLGLRIVLGVGLGVTLILLLFGAVAWIMVSGAVKAAATEQVTLAETEAAQLGEILSASQANSDPAAIPINRLQQVLARTTPPNVAIQVISTSGRVVAQTGGVSADMVAEHVVLLRASIQAARPGYAVHRPSAGDSFTPHIVAYAPVPGYANLGVFVQQTQGTILDAPDRLLRWLVDAGLLALALAVSVAWLDVSRVIRPLQILTAAAERFALGQLSEPVVVARSDEIGSLANSFEVMRQRLRQSLAEIEGWNQELERRVERRTHDLEQRNRQLAMINVIAANLSDPLRVGPMLERTLPLIAEATQFDVAAYRLVTTNRTLSLIAAYHLPAAMALESISCGQCLCGQAAATGACRYSQGLDHEPGADACRLAGVKCSVAVPLRSTDRVEGVLCLGSTAERSVGPGDLDTLGAIGHQVGMAIANARLYTAVQQRERERAQLLADVITAQEDERRRLAGELHDDVSQALTSILLQIEAQAMPGEPGAIEEATRDNVRHLIASTIESVHRLAAELRPSLLDDIGLVAALERLIADYQRRLDLPVEIQTVDVETLQLLPAVETALYRIAQAALNNVARHAAAHAVSVLLQRRGDHLILVIEDDGRGFDLSAIRSAPLENRLGLAGIEERARLIGARLTIESSSGHGTALFVDVPIVGNLSPETVHAETTRAARG